MIMQGKLAGIKGVVLAVRKGWRVIISVPLINQSLRIETDYDALGSLDAATLVPLRDQQPSREFRLQEQMRAFDAYVRNVGQHDKVG